MEYKTYPNTVPIYKTLSMTDNPFIVVIYFPVLSFTLCQSTVSNKSVFGIIYVSAYYLLFLLDCLDSTLAYTVIVMYTIIYTLSCIYGALHYTHKYASSWQIATMFGVNTVFVSRVVIIQMLISVVAYTC